MKKIKFLLFIEIFLSAAGASAQNHSEIFYNVKQFGASGNGIEYDTKALQSAVDSAFSNGGGTVFFPAGKYLTKTIVLKSSVRLLLDNGSVILGSVELNEFKPEYGSFKDSGGRKFGAALIFAKDAENISIEGNGTIDGQGFVKYYPNDRTISRPSIIRFINCKKVMVKDVTLINSAAWVQHYIRCEDLTISGIMVSSYSNKNNDGLDIESCERVYITGCNINSEDDSIVLKALTAKACRDVVISDCILSGLKSAIKTGTESIGNFENITISNCAVYGTRGISLLAVDGGSINNVTISNISMRESYAVIVIRLGERLRPYSVEESKRPKTAGTIKNIIISNIQAVNVTESNDFISGIPNHYVENVTLSNIEIEYAGGGKAADSEREIPEAIKQYPKARMFGTLPAYGLFVRHTKNIKFNNLLFTYKERECRSALKFDDVINAEVNGLSAESGESSAPLIWLQNSGRIKIRNSSPLGRNGTFLKTENCGRVFLINNELSKSKTAIFSDKKSKDKIIEINNY